MRENARLSIGLVVAIALHLCVLMLLTINFQQQEQAEQGPIAAELWSAPPLYRASPRLTTPTPRPVMPAPTPEVPTLAKPDIAFKEKPSPKVAPKEKPEKKPEPEPKPEKHPVTPAKAAVKPHPKNAHSGDFDVDAALADLNSSNTTHKPNSNTTQAGSPNGSGKGGGGQFDGYKTRVISRIWPLVQMPDNIPASARVTVQVTLLPTLQVRDVKLLKSSGDPRYDAAVERAVWAAQTFPPLLPGMPFSAVRQLTLEFRP